MRFFWSALALLLLAVAAAQQIELDDYDEALDSEGAYNEEDAATAQDDGDDESEEITTLQQLDNFLSPERDFGGGVLGLFSSSQQHAAMLEHYREVAKHTISNGVPFAHTTSSELLQKYKVPTGGWRIYLHPVPRFVDPAFGDKSKIRYGGTELAEATNKIALVAFISDRYLPLVSRMSQRNEFIFYSNDLPVFIFLVNNGANRQQVSEITAKLRRIALPYRDKIQFAWSEVEDLEDSSHFSLHALVHTVGISAMIKDSETEKMYTLSGEPGVLDDEQAVSTFVQDYVAGKLTPAPEVEEPEKNINLEL